jgi:hypothetical protein
MNPVNEVVKKLREHAEENKLIAYEKGDRLHVIVDSKRFEELKAELGKFVSAERGFRQRTSGIDNLMLVRSRYRKGIKRALNLFTTDFEIKLIRTRGSLIQGKASRSTYLSFSAPNNHEVTKEQLKHFTSLLNKYALKQQKE